MPQAAVRVRDTMKRLERVLADEQARAAERLAVARAQDWFLGWVRRGGPRGPVQALLARSDRRGGAPHRRRPGADGRLAPQRHRHRGRSRRPRGSSQRRRTLASGLGTVRAGVHRPGRRLRFTGGAGAHRARAGASLLPKIAHAAGTQHRRHCRCVWRALRRARAGRITASH